MGFGSAFLTSRRGLVELARMKDLIRSTPWSKNCSPIGQARLAIQVVSALVERDTHFNRRSSVFRRLVSMCAARSGGETAAGAGLTYLSLMAAGRDKDVYSVAMRARAPRTGAMRWAATTLHRPVGHPSQALELGTRGWDVNQLHSVSAAIGARHGLPIFTPDPGPRMTDWVAADHLRENITFLRILHFRCLDRKQMDPTHRDVPRIADHLASPARSPL